MTTLLHRIVLAAVFLSAACGLAWLALAGASIVTEALP